MNFTLHIDSINGGVFLEDSVDEAKRIAAILNIQVTFTFNGILLSVTPNTDCCDVVDEYHEKMNARENERVTA